MYYGFPKGHSTNDTTTSGNVPRFSPLRRMLPSHLVPHSPISSRLRLKDFMTVKTGQKIQSRKLALYRVHRLVCLTAMFPAFVLIRLTRGPSLLVSCLRLLVPIQGADDHGSTIVICFPTQLALRTCHHCLLGHSHCQVHSHFFSHSTTSHS
jgi:hypothetical protein